MEKTTDYRNRIKTLEYIDSRELTAHPGNWRKHPTAQAVALKGVLAEVGIAGALLAYRSERQGGAVTHRRSIYLYSLRGNRDEQRRTR